VRSRHVRPRERAQRFLGERRTGVDHRFAPQVNARTPPPRPRRWRPGLPLSLHDFPLWWFASRGRRSEGTPRQREQARP
jgi:hypothetical protein